MSEGVKLKLRRKGGWGGKVGFSFGFVSYYPTPFLIGNKLKESSPSWVCFARGGNCEHLLVLISTFSSYFLPILLREGSEKGTGWAPGNQPSLTHHNLEGIKLHYINLITKY